VFSTIGKIIPFSTIDPKGGVKPTAETVPTSEIEKIIERTGSKYREKSFEYNFILYLFSSDFAYTPVLIRIDLLLLNPTVPELNLTRQL